MDMLVSPDWATDADATLPLSEATREFVAKYDFPFPLLLDPGQAVGKLYHTHGLIVKRTVYLIGADGVIRYGKRGKPSVEEILTHRQGGHGD